MTTYRNRPKSLKQMRLDMAATGRELVGFRALLATAEQYGMDLEAERLRRSVAEFEQALDDEIQTAADQGFGPEDFEG